MFSTVMLNAPDWKAIFAPKGCLLREGDLIQRTALARTLETIAEHGPDAFYKVSVICHPMRKLTKHVLAGPYRRCSP